MGALRGGRVAASRRGGFLAPLPRGRMLTSSQTTAIGIALVMFLGIVIPGITRYVLLGGAAFLVIATKLCGNGTGLLHGLLR